MVSIEKITQKFVQLDEFLSIIDEIKHIPIQTFLKDKIVVGSAKYYLQVSIECCLDVTNHIIASEGFRAPKDYGDSFKVIEEENIIPSDFSAKLIQMAKFRNRLVHLYSEIDDVYVYEFIKKDIKDIKQFKSIIVEKYY